MRRLKPLSVVSQQAIRSPGGGAGGLLTSVRASAKGCGTWTAKEYGNQDATYTLAAKSEVPRIGEDSAAYLVTRTADGAALHVVQVWVVQGDVLSVLSYATAAPTSDTDTRYAEDLARTAAARLAKQT
jgi:hypothetical protein